MKNSEPVLECAVHHILIIVKLSNLISLILQWLTWLSAIY